MVFLTDHNMVNEFSHSILIGTFTIMIRFCSKRLQNRSFKAIPHKDSAADALSDFSSDCTEIPKAYWRMSRDFCARWRKICKQIKWRPKKRSQRRTLIGWRNLCRAVALSRKAVFVRCCPYKPYTFRPSSALLSYSLTARSQVVCVQSII